MTEEEVREEKTWIWCCQVSSRFSFDPRDIMNFISREETSVIVSVRGLWHTRDGWCSNRCVEKQLGYLTFA